MRHRAVLRSFLCAAGAVFSLALVTNAAYAQSVSFEGTTFVDKGLVGVARAPSNAVDSLGETLGGFGSAATMLPGSWHRRSDGSFVGKLLMVPDRGWNTQGTLDFIGRLQRFDFVLSPFYGVSTTDQNQLQMTYKITNKLHEKKQKPTSGLDPVSVRPATGVFPKLPQASNGKISVDNEGIVYPGDGTMWISDEYGPYVYHYTASGNLIGVIRPPEAFIPKRMSGGVPVDDFSANSPPAGVPATKGNPVSGRQNNQGFEGLTISPDHKKLFILLQSALIQDLDATSATTIRLTRHNTRMLAYDITTSTPALIGEYVVQLPLYAQPVNGGVELRTAAASELLALNDHQFLVLARDSGNGFSLATSKSLYRSVDLIDIADPANPATNIAGSLYDFPDHPVALHGTLDPSITPVAYHQFLNINDDTQLGRFGLHNGDPNDNNDLYEKWESLVVEPVLDRQNPNDYFLFIASDNDFITTDGHMLGQPYHDHADVDTLVLVFRVTLPTYVKPVK